MTPQPPLIVILGPTAVGKTALAVALGEILNAEIVSADSRQVYRYMDIGTAKPSPEERARVPHHLVDIIDPDEPFSLARYQDLAYQAIEAIIQRGKLPMLVGGTGQYIRAIVEGWQIPRVPPNHVLRVQLEREAAEHGPESLHARLQALDPVAAASIDPRNVRRVIRALEVIHATGHPFSAQRGKHPPPYRILQIGLTMDREKLYARADARIDAMIRAGLIDEIQSLLERGYDWSLPAMSSLGYIQFKPYFEGTCTLEEAIHETRRATRRFIRHQYTWFRLNDPQIHWIEAGSPIAPLLEHINRWLEQPSETPTVRED